MTEFSDLELAGHCALYLYVSVSGGSSLRRKQGFLQTSDGNVVRDSGGLSQASQTVLGLVRLV